MVQFYEFPTYMYIIVVLGNLPTLVFPPPQNWVPTLYGISRCVITRGWVQRLFVIPTYAHPLPEVDSGQTPLGNLCVKSLKV